MADILKIDAGPPVHKVNRRTDELAGEALTIIDQHIESLAGREFFGKSNVELLWKAGQIVEIRHSVQPTTI